MKFITEADLRSLFKKEPFTTYHLVPEVRLTPGARQFLSDNRITISDVKNPPVKNIAVGNEQKICTNPKEVNSCNWRLKAYQRRIKFIEASFLSVAQECLSADILLSQKVIKLSKLIHSMKNPLEVKQINQLQGFECCTGITNSNFYDPLEDCFEVNEFHIHLEKGREIINLYKLKCAVQEIEPLVMELSEFSNEDIKQYEEVLNRVYLVTNSLSQLICLAIGGTECLKKN